MGFIFTMAACLTTPQQNSSHVLFIISFPPLQYSLPFLFPLQPMLTCLLCFNITPYTIVCLIFIRKKIIMEFFLFLCESHKMINCRDMKNAIYVKSFLHSHFSKLTHGWMIAKWIYIKNAELKEEKNHLRARCVYIIEGSLCRRVFFIMKAFLGRFWRWIDFGRIFWWLVTDLSDLNWFFFQIFELTVFQNSN